MTTTRTYILNGLAWVLPQGIGAGIELPAADAPSDALAQFSPKPYLDSVKGYLDAGAAYLLAAVALALGEQRQSLCSTGLRANSGICSLSRYGATDSASKFYNLFLIKGPRSASPLIFPHAYSNAAGNLAAIEYGFGGPHMVFSGATTIAEAWHFAVARLDDDTADDMLVAAYEAVAPGTVADHLPTPHGAIVAWLRRQPLGNALASIRMPEPAALLTGIDADGNAIEQMQQFLQIIDKQQLKTTTA